MLDLIGHGSIGQAIVRRVSAGKQVLFADLEDVYVEGDHRPNGLSSTGKPWRSRIGSSKVAPPPQRKDSRGCAKSDRWRVPLRRRRREGFAGICLHAALGGGLETGFQISFEIGHDHRRSSSVAPLVLPWPAL